MRVMILGGDGYLGWPTALHLSHSGFEVAVLDNYLRRGYDEELGSASLVPIHSLPERVRAWEQLTGRVIEVYEVDLLDGDAVVRAVSEFRPDTIVHYAEQRSAPYSMIDRRHAVHTQTNNVIGTLNVLFAIAEVDPGIHLVKLGTMGDRDGDTARGERVFERRRRERAGVGPREQSRKMAIAFFGAWS